MAVSACCRCRHDASPTRSWVDYRSSIYQYSSMARERPLPAASLHVVFALLDGELHGYALMRRVDELSDGGVRMGPGTLYGTLNRLVEGGLIEETTERRSRPGNERRRASRTRLAPIPTFRSSASG